MPLSNSETWKRCKVESRLKEMGERELCRESAFFHFIPQFVSEDDLFNKKYTRLTEDGSHKQTIKRGKKVKGDEEEKGVT